MHTLRPRHDFTLWLAVFAITVFTFNTASAVDPVTDLGCEIVSGDQGELSWTNPSVTAGSQHVALTQSLAPIAFWRIGESSGTTLFDEQGLVNGTYRNGPTLGFGGAILDDPNTAVYFDGGNDFAEIPHDDAMLLDSGTVTFWVYPHKHDKVHGLFSKDSTGYDTGGHFTILWEKSKFVARLQSTTASYFVQSEVVPDNCWYHVAVSWGAAGMKLYLDGNLISTNAYPGGLGTSSGGIGNFEPLALAANAWSSGDLTTSGIKEELDGRMDEVALYDVALSDADVLALSSAQVPSGYDYATTAALMNPDSHWRFEESAGTVAADQSAAYDGTYSASVSLAGVGATIGGLAPTLDGITGEIVVSDPTAYQLDQEDMVVACWFNAAASPAVLFSLGNPGTSSSENTLFELEFAGDRFFYRHERSSASVVETELLLSKALPLGTWHHAAIVKSKQRKLVRLFVNGELAASDSYPDHAQNGSDSDLYWGNNPAGSKPLLGQIDEGVLFTRCVSGAFIRALANPMRGEAIRIERDGTEIDLLDASTTTFSDPGLAPGEYDYCVSYLVDGVASTQECCTVSTLQAVSNLACTFTASSIDLTWTLPETYTEIIVLRDAVQIATLSGSATSYSDTSPPAGAVSYEVIARVGVDDAPTASCTVDFSPSVTGATCSFDRDTATVTWTNTASYDAVDILRDTVLVATLPGSATQFVDTGLLAGSYAYEIVGLLGAGSSVPAECNGVVHAAPSDVTCCSTGSGTVELCWTDSVGYDAVEVYRDGTLVATSVAPPCYVDTPGAGTYGYTLVGIVAGQGSLEAVCAATILSPPSAVSCTQASSPCNPPADVDLTWVNNSTATSIEVLRDGVVLAAVSATTTSYTDTAVADGTYVYTIRPLAADCASETASCSVDVTSATSPSFSLQPASQTVCPGVTIALTVAVTGTTPVALQWRKDGVDISGATNASLVISPVSATDAGAYDIVASNECAAVSSAVAILTVNDPASATITGPVTGICSGDDVTLTATAAGSNPVTLQWRINGVDLGGETATTLTLTNVSGADVATYDVVATNSCGSEASNSYGLTLLDDAQITSDPTSQTDCEGGSVTFAVGTTGTAPISLQWRKDGVAIAGATADSYTIVSTVAGDSGIYDAVATNDCATATSAGATLTVQTAATVSSVGPASFVCEGSSATFTATPSGSAPITLQWQKDGVDISGATGAVLSFASVSAGDAGSYTVVASNGCGNATSNATNLDVKTPATVSTAPTSQDACEGGTVTFAVAVNGSAPLTVQWRKDGVDVPGATSMTYSIASATVSDAGTYDVVVTNDCATATSAAATLTVQTAATVSIVGPASFVCEDASVTFTSSVTGTAPMTLQWQKDGVDIAGATAASLTVSSAVAADSGSYTLVAGNACGTETSNAALLDVRTPAVVTLDPTSQSVCEGDAVTMTIAVTGTAPIAVQWQRDGINIAGATSSSYTIATTVAGDSAVYDAVVTNDCATTTSAAATLTVQTAATVSIAGPVDALCSGSPATFTATTGGTPPVSIQWQKDGVDLPGATGATLTISSTTTADSGSYTAVAVNGCGAVTSNALLLDVLESPNLTSTPVDAEVCEGSPFTLEVAATGSTPLDYQWFRDGASIPGATAATLTIASMSAADVGAYTAQVSNACGSQTTSAAQLSVGAGPVITSVSIPSAICEGDGAVLSVTATGGVPLSYQWQKDGIAIGGATDAILTIASMTSAEVGSYDVIVTNDCGTVTSAGQAVVLSTTPTLDTEPASGAPCLGDAVVLSVVASGTGPLAYAWSVDGAAISGADEATLTIASAELSDSGTYTVSVSGPCGTVTSSGALLTVGQPPVIVSDPLGGSFTESETVLLSVTATGADSFQWHRDGVDLVGATASSLTIDPVSIADSGAYTCSIDNSCGSVESAAATVSVSGVPAVTNLVCCTLNNIATLCWSNPFAYETVEVYRDGSSIAVLTGDTSCYEDPNPIATTTYEVVGRVGDFSSGFTNCTVDALPTLTILLCDGSASGVALSWLGATTAFDDIRVLRDGLEIAVLPAPSSSYTDSDPVAPFIHEYEIVATAAGPLCDSYSTTSCTATGDVAVEGVFVRGDSNNDMTINLADSIFILSYQFADGATPSCLDAADANDDGTVDISDGIWLTSYFFTDGPAPFTPFPSPGVDPTEDSLTCDFSVWAP